MSVCVDKIEGKLAREFGGKMLPLKILESAAGFYFGTHDEEGPYSRESVEYYDTRSEAEAAYINDTWTQRIWV